MGNLSDYDFNASSMPESSNDFSTIPAGWYTASITEAVLQDTRAGTGQYIKLRMDISGPSHAGRVLFTNLNIRNPNSVAEQIGRQQLGEIMRSVGLSSVTDTDQLIGHSLQIKVSRKEDTSQYADADGFRNEVDSFKAIAGSKPPMPAAAAPAPQAAAPQQQPAAAPAASSGTPPWAK